MSEATVEVNIDEELEEQFQRVVDEVKDMEKLLVEFYPEGSAVLVRLNSRQKNLSPAKVVGHSGDRGVVTVRLDKLNRRGFGTVKRVHFKDVYPKEA